MSVLFLLDWLSRIARRPVPRFVREARVSAGSKKVIGGNEICSAL